MPTIDLVIPVYNEEKDLPRSIQTLTSFLRSYLAYPWRIVIADNGSTDRTLELAQELSARYSGEVTYLHLPEKGRGRALRRAWLESSADIVSYMDVDLSTELAAYPPLIQAIAEEGYDVAIGSRLAPGAKVKRSFRRDVISRGYNFLIKVMFFTRFHDAQCGFKAVSRRATQDLVPLIRDQAWFFDTELLLLATRKGYRIKEIPVTWVEDPDTRVRILRTVWQDIKGLLRLRFCRLP